MAQFEADEYLKELKEAFVEGFLAGSRKLDCDTSFEVFVKMKIEKRLFKEQRNDKVQSNLIR